MRTFIRAAAWLGRPRLSVVGVLNLVLVGLLFSQGRYVTGVVVYVLGFFADLICDAAGDTSVAKGTRA